MAAKVAFVIQGEGRGHFSQALAMQDLMSGKGWEICAVLVGTNSRRQIPSYIYEAFGPKIFTFKSPNFDVDSRGRGILVTKSIGKSLLGFSTYLRAAKAIVQHIKESQAELVINFYEPLFGLSQFLWPLSIPKVSVAHQFMLYHPFFQLPSYPIKDKFGLRLLTYITQKGSDLLLALSFYSKDSASKRLRVVPPLLRKRLRDAQTHKTKENFYLVYILNKGFAEDIDNWHKEHADVEIHCFWDNYDRPAHYSPRANLHFHHLSGPEFLEKMALCKALISTAGFESVCEALYLEKPVAMIPVIGHYEQKVNSYDALNTGLTLRFDTFNMGQIMEGLKNLDNSNPEMGHIKKWFDQSDQTILYLLNELLKRRQ